MLHLFLQGYPAVGSLHDPIAHTFKILHEHFPEGIVVVND
jgi:hypothetical protein